MRSLLLCCLCLLLAAGENDPQAEFDKRLAKLTPDQTEERVSLARWATTKGLANEAGKLLDEVIAAKPDHAVARKLRGYEQIDGAWLRGEDLWKAKKWIQYLGRWMPPAEKLKLTTRRDALRKQLKDHSSWDKAWEQKTAHFQFKSNAPYRVVQDMCSAMELYYDQAAKVFQLTGKQANIPVEVYATQDEFQKATIADHMQVSENVLGYYLPGRDLIRAYHMGSIDQTLSTLFHECTHLIFQRFAKREIPTWTNEGLAVFFEDAERQENKIDILAVPWSRLWHLRMMVEKGKVDLTDTILCTHQAYKAEYYPRGWSLCHFLLFGAGGKYKKGFDAYISAFKKGGSERDNLEFFTKYVGKKPSELQSEWETYIKGIEPKEADEFAAAARTSCGIFLDLAKAQGYADKAVELAPQAWGSHSARGLVLLTSARLRGNQPGLAKAAVDSYDRALEVSQFDPAKLKAKAKKGDSIAMWTTLLAERVFALAMAGDGERALAAAGELIDIDEVNAHAYAALALLGTGDAADLAEAEADLAIARDLGNDHIVRWVGSRVALAAGRIDEAKRLLKEAAELDAFGMGRIWYAMELKALDKPAKAAPSKP